MNAHPKFRRTNMTSKGQVLIPKEVRERTGLTPGKPVRVGVNDRGEAVVVPDAGEDSEEVRSQRYSEALRSITGIWNSDRSTDEIMRELRGDDPFV